MADENPRACRSAELNAEMLKAASIRVRSMWYAPGGLNCGAVKVNWKTGFVEAPPVMGRSWRPNRVVPGALVNTILPLPVAAVLKPLLSSRATMVTVKIACPAPVSAESGEMLKLMSCGGVASAHAAPANSAAATMAHRHGRLRPKI